MKLFKGGDAARFSSPIGRSFRLAYIAVTLLCLLCCFCLVFSDLYTAETGFQFTLDRPEGEQAVAGADPYVQQADAWLKGQLYLDFPVAEELLGMENPFDTEARSKLMEESPFWYPWDRALYNGRYYSYFGATPVLLLYMPFYLLFGTFPTVSFACLLFSCGAVVALAAFLRELFLRYFSRGGKALLCLALPCLCACGGIFTAAMMGDWYYLPVACALCFSLAFYALLLRGIRQTDGFRFLFFGLAALCLTLVVFSRPSSLILCFAALPFFLSHLLNRRLAPRHRLLSAVSFASPLLLGAGAVMLYNALRFSSPFDFGAAYQLTVSDVSLNTVELGLLPHSLLQYFFQSPITDYKTGLPLPSYLNLSYSAAFPLRFIYTEVTVGAVHFPVTLLSLLPFALPRFLRRKGADPAEVSDLTAYRTAELRLYRYAVLLLSLVCAFLVYCTAGVNLRYLYDFLLPLSVCGFVCGTVFCQKLRNPLARTVCYTVCALALLWGVVQFLGIRVCFSYIL